jgi:hypothetical protein
MSEAYATLDSTQVAIACRPEYLDVRAEAGASNLQNSSAINRRVKDTTGRVALLFELEEEQ